MHSITSTTSRAHRPAFVALLAVLVLLAVAAPALAAANYEGGPQAGDYPLYVANDHSVYALRFSASGLTASTEYYVKIRISPTATPSGGSSRGFTWNPAGNAGAGAWVQEREDWPSFPTITTAADGTYAPGSNWTFFKFGDATKPAAGTSSTWYIVVSLQPVVGGGSGTTTNSSEMCPVTIVDMTGDLGGATAAFRVHNGTPVGASKSQRVNALATGSADAYYSVMRTEPNAVDEGYGGTAAGDFDIAVPAGLAFDTSVNSTSPAWSVLGFSGTTADVDIALGAADTVPPAAPDGFASAIDGTAARLSWDAVDGADSYIIYQWQDATPLGDPPATNYTPQHLVVGTTTATTYDVTGLTEGETYHFEVRAVDEATNVGPPSRYPVTLTLQASRSTVAWKGSAQLSGELSDGAEPFAGGQQVTLEWSYDGSNWKTVGVLDPITSFTYGATIQPQRKTMYRLAFATDGVHQAATSDSVTVTPKVKLSSPVAPKIAKKGRRYTVYGSLAPRHASGSKTVKVKCYRRSAGKWQLKRVYTATNRNYSSASRYLAKVRLTARGQWRLVATYRATSKYATTTSGARYVRVK